MTASTLRASAPCERALRSTVAYAEEIQYVSCKLDYRRLSVTRDYYGEGSDSGQCLGELQTFTPAP